VPIEKNNQTELKNHPNPSPNNQLIKTKCEEFWLSSNIPPPP
jgi:hypothetical protein